MDDTGDKKPIVTEKVVPMISKITDQKLNCLNYLDWGKTIRIYVRSICIASHLNKDPPTDDSKEQWIEEGARIFL